MTVPQMLQLSTLRTAYLAGLLTPEDVVATVLERVRAYPDPAVWIASVSEAKLLERARSLPADRASIEALPLYGIPFAVKDNIDVAGMPTTAGCPAFAYEPAESAFVVERLLAAGAILIGKTNLDQFATGLVGTRSPHGAPRCVFDERYVSGGSSSGSAVAVAAGLCSFSLGTDTAGSGRVPAAFNNIVGYKPTKGRLSTRGVVPACRSVDCVTIFAASVDEAREIAAVAQRFDEADPYSRRPVDAAIPLEQFRFGVLAPADRQFFGDVEASELYDASIERLADCGGTPVEIDYAPFRDAAALLYGGPWVAERLAAIAPFFAANAAALHPTVREIIGGAQRFSAVDAFEGQYRLRALEKQAAHQWDEIDVMLLPTTPTIYTVEDVERDPIRLNSNLGLYTNFVNLLDYGAIAIPAGFRVGNGLPFGVTLIGPAFADDDLASIADRLQRSEGTGVGKALDPIAAAVAPSIEARPDAVAIAVAGAHLSGFPLNHQLLELGATLVRTCATDGEYRLFALSTDPAKPGLVRDPGFAGPGIEVEVWSLSIAAFGQLVASVPTPMAIGKLRLHDGTEVAGFLCEQHALADAPEITAWGGWRRYLSNAPS
ncbi:MAG: atzF [Candidatus Eremiobacteraeota bacterium]|nr:atzF [Candidatus Eremiobacteraeota bacterium]